MKTFSVAVAVAVMLTFICIQENSAVPVVGVEEMEEMPSNDSPVAAVSEDSRKMGKWSYFSKFNIPKIKCGRCCTRSFCIFCCRAQS
ncbi:hepcidin-like [Scomber japonicus]|uniref:hepcidin-like n=1 Tax=Scomber japonicus TaxID=13676 RepID=UPI002305D971|nr:hepcidin-like [Scomber japonicus]